MYRITGAFVATNGHVDLSLRDPSGWGRSPVSDLPGFDYEMVGVLLGDETTGPFLVLTTGGPRTEPLPLSAPHGHDCDSWRIAIKGQLRMGQRRYGAGEFRFQEGGKPYGADDPAAWGPNGGCSVIMMADRRGPTPRTVDRNLRQAHADGAKPWYDWLGISVPDVYPGKAGVVTTLGSPDKGGGVEGSFNDTSSWRGLLPGVRMAAGLCGDHESGPVVVLVQAESGVTAFPAISFGTEVLHLIVSGSCSIGCDRRERADIRIVEAGVATPAVVAGPAGLGVAIVLGDRRGVRATLTARGASCEWAAALRDVLHQLEERGLASVDG